MSKKPYLDYYQHQKFIPVQQDLSDVAAHRARRERLYRYLGIVLALLRGSSVIEFGPGTGDNAAVTSLYGPDEYILVDGHQTAVEMLKKKVEAGEIRGAKVEYVEADLIDYPEGKLYDVVICEGVLPG